MLKNQEGEIQEAEFTPSYILIHPGLKEAKRLALGSELRRY